MASNNQDYLSIAYKEEEQLLQLQWLRNVSSEEYRAGVRLLAELIVTKPVVSLLIDSRRLSNVPFADQQWIKREVAPAVVGSNLQKFARVLTQDIFNYISFENLLQHITEEHKATVEIAQFTTVEAALAWLKMD